MSNEKTKTTLPKEKIYDEQIEPLLKQIHEICNEHDISSVSAFSLGTREGKTDDEKANLMAISMRNVNKEDPAARKFAKIGGILRNDPLIGIASIMAGIIGGGSDDCDCEACTERRKAEAAQKSECNCSEESNQEAKPEKAE